MKTRTFRYVGKTTAKMPGRLAEDCITSEEVEAILPAIQSALFTLYRFKAKCRRVETALGRDIDGLETALQDMMNDGQNPDLLSAEDACEFINDNCLTVSPRAVRNRRRVERRDPRAAE